MPWSQKGTGIDKISVLRLTSAFMKYKDFWEACKEIDKKTYFDVLRNIIQLICCGLIYYLIDTIQ